MLDAFYRNNGHAAVRALRVGSYADGPTHVVFSPKRLGV